MKKDKVLMAKTENKVLMAKTENKVLMAKTENKVLIATAIHSSKHYVIEKWIENVSNLQMVYSADLLLVDNSPNPNYVKVVDDYCEKYKLKNYQIVHLSLPDEQNKFERIAHCREYIRNRVISENYDMWFSWECDQIIPNDALRKLIKIAKSGDFSIVAHNNWTRQTQDLPNYDWGVALIKRKALKKYSFILDFGSDPEMPDSYEPSEHWFRKRVLRDGGKYVEVTGFISPIYHLNNLNEALLKF